MNAPRVVHVILVWWLVLWMAAPTGAFAQQSTQQTSGAPLFKPEQLEQIVSPIALYPDELLAQIFMASTYPLEIVQAARWVKANPGLKGDQLAKALEQQNWDPSVRSLVNFPEVLNMMNEKLDWTQQLGDAVLAQQKDVMAAVQRLRKKAYDAGNLKTTKEQVVKVDTAYEAAQPSGAGVPSQPPPSAPPQQVIVIQPANPQVIYVPTYNPTVVYGVWAYPAYPPPPVYAYPYGAMAFSFAAGVAAGAAWGYAWGGCNWHGGDVDVNVWRNQNINNNINRNNYQNKVTNGQGGRGEWKHNPENRRGVAYRDQGTANRFGQQPRVSNDMRQNFAGRDGAGGRGQGIGGSQASQQPARGPDRGGAGGSRGDGLGRQPSQQPAGGDRGGLGGSRGQAGPGRDNAFGGYNRGSDTRQASNRGNQSLASDRGRSGSGGGGGLSSGSSGGGGRSGGGGLGGGGRSGGGGGRGGGRR